MMNKMTGIILMIIGALFLGVGIFVYSTSSKNNVATAKDSSQVKMPEEKNSPVSANEPKDNELEKVIEMAIADGVLTANERKLIKKIAISKGVDYVAVLDDVEKRIDLLEID